MENRNIWDMGAQMDAFETFNAGSSGQSAADMQSDTYAGRSAVNMQSDTYAGQITSGTQSDAAGQTTSGTQSDACLLYTSRCV